MILTLILLGFILGRRWPLALIIAVVGWPALLVATGVADAGVGLLGTALVAAVNTGVGIAIRQALGWFIGLFRRGD